MYIVTKKAACWVDRPVDAARIRAPRPERIQRWADRRLHTDRGTVIAIRFEGEDVRVLVEDSGKRQWQPIAWVMDEAQAKRWIKTCFSRGGKKYPGCE